jgi:serine/threonine protein kinase
MNAALIIKHLESMDLFEGRYTNLKCCSFDLVSKKRRGRLSIVFKAIDKIQGCNVAIKVYDPSPQNMADLYRLNAFRREPEILTKLLNKTRCLQLVAGYETFTLETKMGEYVLSTPVFYFVTEWIEREIDDFFEKQNMIEASQKLTLFREILNAVEAFHSRGVVHRDLKPDNLRARDLPGDRDVVAIDFGSGVASDSDTSLDTYRSNVGAPYHSAPEAMLGLAGHRTVAKLTDYYALGCMLYELFHYGYFLSLTLRNREYQSAMLLIGARLSREPDTQKKYLIWTQEAPRIAKAVRLGPFFGRDSTAPRSLEGLLERIVDGLTRFDFQDRALLIPSVRDLVDTSLKVLDNSEAQARIARQARERRARRHDRVAELDLRFERLGVAERGRRNA